MTVFRDPADLRWRNVRSIRIPGMSRPYDGLGDVEASLVGEPELPPCDYGKSQWVRIADVVAVGPLMIWGGYALHKKSKLGGWALGLVGAATIALNGYNFIRFGGFASAGQETQR